MGKKVCVVTTSTRAKKHTSSLAKDMFQGQFFDNVVKLCDKMEFDLYILSAKYGLLHPNEVIKPYDITLNNFSKKERKKWSDKVKKQMIENDLYKNDLYFFTGKNYHEFFKGNKPLKGLSLGFQLKWFNEKLKLNKGFDL